MLRSIHLKENVKFGKIHESFISFAQAVINTWDIHASDIVPVITSANDSVHGTNSLHPHDRAWDLRTNNLPKEKIPEIARTLRILLGADYDIIIEKDHIHGEYQPK